MFALLAWLSGALLLQVGAQAQPYRDFRNAGAGFYGDGREYQAPADITSVRIGVLGPARSRAGLHQRTGVQIAVEEANSRGGYCLQAKTPSMSDGAEVAVETPRCLPYEIVFREDDGPWGVAAQQVVRLAYEDRVWTIIGGLDGQQTHLAELVVSKAWVPVVSPGATDASIDYANVPWVFRAVPADTEQVSALLGLAEKRGYKHLVVLTEIQREAHTGFLRLREGSGRRRYSLELHLEYTSQNPAQVIPQLHKVPLDAVLIWGKAESALTLIKALRLAGIKVPILGPSALAALQIAESGALLGELTVAAPCDLSRGDDAYRAFGREFRNRTGEQPSISALYSYDVARLVIGTIEMAGLNRARIRDRLSSANFEGLTGKIAFNSLGGNPAAPILMYLDRNRWVRLE